MDIQDITKEIGVGVSRRQKREYTQDFIPIERIEDGVLICKENGKKRFVKIMEILPINLHLKSDDEKDGVIRDYIRFLKDAPSKLQIKIITRLTNFEDYVKAAHDAYMVEANEACRELIVNYISHLQNTVSYETIEKHYYLIFEYERSPYDNRVPKSEEEYIEALNKTAENIKKSFRSMGNESIIFNSENISDICELLYNFFNRNTSRTEPFSERVARIMSDNKLVNGLREDENLSDYDVELDVNDIIAPKSIDFDESPDYYVIDGQYRAHYYIRSKTYPSTMNTLSGWLNRIVNFGYGFDTDIFFSKSDAVKRLEALRFQSKLASIGMRNVEREQTTFKERMSNYNATMYLMDALNNNADVYDMVVMVTITVDTLSDFYDCRMAMLREANKMNIKFGECKRFQEEGYFSFLPTLSLSPKIYSLSHRNLTTQGVAASYNFTAYSLMDKKGILLGVHATSNSAVVMDLHDASQYANPNIGIYGAPGNGKTFTLMTITSRMRYHGTQVFIISPEKQDEFRRICNALGGEFVDISPASRQRINIFDIRPLSAPDLDAVGGTSSQNKAWVIDKIDNLKIFFEYLYPSITLPQLSLLEKHLVKMYEDFGITEDNNSIFKNGTDGELKTMPIFSDFYNRINADPEFERSENKGIKIIIETFVTGAAKNLNGQTNIDLDNKYIVFGLENLKGHLFAPLMFIVLEYIWGKAREDKTKRKAIAIDEGWMLLSNSNPQVAKFVQEMFKISRSYNTSSIFSTQSIVDLFSAEGNYGNAILSCAHSNIILGMERKDIGYIRGELGLTDAEVSNIAKARVDADLGSMALLCAGQNHIPIYIQATAKEYDLFTTRPEDVASQVQKYKEQGV